MHVEHIQFKLEHTTHMEIPKNNQEKGIGLKFIFTPMFFSAYKIFSNV